MTSGAGLLRIDPRTARLTASLPGPVSAVATGAGGVWAVCCQGRVRRGRVTRLDPTSGRVIAAVGLPARPLAVGAGPGGVWVRGAEGWRWRVDLAGDRQAGAIGLPTVPGSAELAGEVVVAGEVIWASDPGAGIVRRVDLRSGAEDRWEADGATSRRHPAGRSGRPAKPGCSAWAARRCVALAVTCASWRLIGSPPWRLLTTVGCGWARPRGCSTSIGPFCARDSTASGVPRTGPSRQIG